MAKKKPRRDGKHKPSGRPRQRMPEELPELPDRRAMEATLRELTGDTPDADSPEGKAQVLLNRAFQERDPDHRAHLAREALAAWPDCADAYVLLAEHAHSRREALALSRKAVEAGERVLGPGYFQEHTGHFWGLLPTRPYMRARIGLAMELWMAGRRDEAVGHLQDMLRLNPNDHQGIRYVLAGYLLNLDRDDELTQFLHQYPDDPTAFWAYTRALLAFRREGDTIDARRSLKQARKANPHVPPYLLGEKYPPAELPPYYGVGDENEALTYIGGALGAWKSTPGAIAWLRANVNKPAKQAEPEPRGPLTLIKRWLQQHLPQVSEVWQADARRLPGWVRSGTGMIRPWVLMVTEPADDQVLAHNIVGEEPSAEGLWDHLAQAMQHPLAGEPRRPTELHVRPSERWESLRPHFEEIGIRLAATEELDQLNAVFQSMVEHVMGPQQPGLLAAPGVTPEHVASAYDAAATFYQRAPWRLVGYESAIKVECDRFQSGPWYAVIMGQSGLTMGLTLYESLDLLRTLWSSGMSDEENARRTVATTVTFGDETETPIADLDAAERHGWRVAISGAYPSFFHKERGMTMRPPLTWELELLEACLRAVPDFVKRRPQDDPTREEVTVPTAAGELKLGLAWVVEE